LDVIEWFKQLKWLPVIVVVLMFVAFLMQGIANALSGLPFDTYPESIAMVLQGLQQFFSHQGIILIIAMANNFLGYGIKWLTANEDYDPQKLLKTIVVFEAVVTPLIAFLQNFTLISEAPYVAAALVWVLWMLHTFYEQITQ
jgi:hypothetical protein